MCFLLVLAACGNKKSGPPEPATYRYSLAMGPRFNANPSIKIRINGKDAGTNSELAVPREVKLGDPAIKLEAVFETTCGTEAFALGPGALPPDEAAERKKDPTGIISWGASAPESMPDKVELYIDNQWTGKTAKIEIGNRSYEVGAQTSKKSDVVLGTCATARTVKVDGAVVGELPELGRKWAVLISTTKDMCYVEGSEQYGADIYEQEKPSVFKLPGHVGKVSEKDYPLVELPEKIVEAPDRVAKQVSVLISMPCELWSTTAKSIRDAGSRAKTKK
jgi:hypothetical protein